MVLEKDLWKKLLAELVGAFIVTVSVVFPAIALRDAGLGAFLFIMFTAGLGLSVAVWLTRDISGGHANPAVTFAMMVAQKTSVVTGVLYWVAQLAGAVLAAYYAKATFNIEGADLGGLGTAMPTPGYKDAQVMMAEAIGVFILVTVVYAVMNVKDKVQAGLAIGFALLIGVVMTAPVSGGALNPAREFGPMLVSNSFKSVYLWYFIVAPFLGALVAVIVQMIMTDGFKFKLRMPVAKKMSADDEE
jgi:MIP family channel proteins